MKRLLLLLFVAVASLATQETKLPSDAYCMAGPPPKNDQRGHECKCELVCVIGPGDVVVGDHESTTCKLYCRRDKCLCHADEACKPPKG